MIADAVIDGQAVLVFQDGFKEVKLNLCFLFVGFEGIHDGVPAVDDKIDFGFELLGVMERFGHTGFGNGSGFYMDIAQMGQPHQGLPGRFSEIRSGGEEKSRSKPDRGVPDKFSALHLIRILG